MELTVDGVRLVSPPQYAVWIPPGHEHASVHSQTIAYRSVYLAADQCKDLPNVVCPMSVSDLLRALLEEISRLGFAEPVTAEHKRLADVVRDQILQMQPVQNFLPSTENPLLRAAMLDAEHHLDATKPIGEIARSQNMSVRTFERLALDQLGMSFGEWRQRLKFVKAVEALMNGVPIKQVASQVGYNTASSFIDMFKRHAGETPDKYRKLRRD